MKHAKKILAVTLAFVCCFNILFTQPTYAAETTTSVFSSETTSETVKIDGVNYTFNYSLDNGNRIVTITNNVNNSVDKIVYDVNTSTMYLNGKVFSIRLNDSAVLYSNGTTADGWEILSKDSYRITWKQGTTAAAIAAMIAAYLGSLGSAGVIAAMGFSALSAIAANASGGKLYVELHMYTVPFVAPQYRFEWRFTASTGDSYGPYYYLYYA